MLWFALHDFFMFDNPVVVLIEESENLSEVFAGFLEEVVEDVVFSPFNALVVVKVICL